MKTVVCLEPDAVLLALNDLSRDNFLCDPDTYYYFRDTVFIDGIKEFIRANYPGELPPGKVVDDMYYSPRLSPEFAKRSAVRADSDAAKFLLALDTEHVIARYYKKWNKKRPKYYLYKGAIYSFTFWGFSNITNVIELIKYEPEDLLKILNKGRT
jgi:hypothetical protein